MKRPTSSDWTYYESNGRFALVERTATGLRITEGKLGTSGRARERSIGGLAARRAACDAANDERLETMGLARNHRKGWTPPWEAAPPPAKPALVLDPALPSVFRGRIEAIYGIDHDWVRSKPVKARGKVWRPTARAVVIDGDLEAAGDVVIGTGKHDGGAVIVLGAVRCANLEVAAGFAFACTGELTATGTIVAAAPDIAAYVGGKVRCARLISGEHGWLEVHDAAQLRGVPIDGYAMVGMRPTKVTRARSVKSGERPHRR